MNIDETIEWLRERLQQPLPGLKAQERMIGRVLQMPLVVPEDARASAVLIVLFPKDGELYILLMKRTEDGRAHSGQISFPGGKQETFDADLRATALREANEEVGIMSNEVDIIGGLTPLYIPVSNFQVYPFIAYTDKRPQYLLSANEVERIIEVPLQWFLEEGNKTEERVTSPVDKSFVRKVHAYKLEDGSIVWGATAMILSELEVMLSEPEF